MPNTTHLNPLVLIIEDEATQRRLLDNQLQSQGYQVAVATNGREGLALWAERPDIRMVITSRRQRMPAARAGSDDFAGKPVLLAALDLRLQSHFGRFRPAR